MANATGTLPATRHDDPSSRSPWRRSSVASLFTEQVGHFSIADLGHFSKAPKQITQAGLLIAVIIASVPMCIEMIRQIRRRNFSVDVLAVASITSALAFREYWVAAIVVLMLSGGKSLEE